MGVQVEIEDDLGNRYSGRSGALYHSDTKYVAQLLLDPLFWETIGSVCEVSLKEITLVVPGDDVPDDASPRYTSWDDFYQSHYQAIDPLIHSLEYLIAWIHTHTDWFRQFQEAWFTHEALAVYYYDHYFPEGYFLEDITDMANVLRQSRARGATSVCIALR